MPAGPEETGKKGAMPDPLSDALAGNPCLENAWGYTPRSRNCEYFSIVYCEQACRDDEELEEIARNKRFIVT